MAARSRPGRAGPPAARPPGSGTTSPVPPIRVATTGRPPARASSAATPSGSTVLTMASRSQAATQSATSPCGTAPRRITAPRAPGAGPRHRPRRASGPSPTSASRASGRLRRTRANAWSSPSGFLRSVRPPTASTRGPSGASPRRARAAGRSAGRSARCRRPCRSRGPAAATGPVAPSPSARWRLTAITAAARRSGRGRGPPHGGARQVADVLAVGGQHDGDAAGRPPPRPATAPVGKR